MKNLYQAIFCTSLLTILIGILPAELKAQNAPLSQWQNTIGGKLNDIIYYMIKTDDEGYLLGGISYSMNDGDKTEATKGVADYWVVKIDSVGNIIFQNDIGSENQDYLQAMVQCSDGGYLLAGYSNSESSSDKSESNIGGFDYWVVKLDGAGNILWDNTIGGNKDDKLYSVVQSTDGGYLLAGYSLSGNTGDKNEASNGFEDYWIVKLDALGNIEWQNTIGGSDVDECFAIVNTTDGGYMLGGWSFSNISGDKSEISQGQMDYWVVKIDATGNIMWQNTIGGDGPDGLLAITETSDDGFLLGGFSSSGISGDKTEANVNFTADYWVVKIDLTGDILWQNNIGGNSSDLLYSVTQTTDGGYVLGGLSFSDISGEKTEVNLGLEDYWVMKLDGSGNIEWQNTMGGKSSDILYSVLENEKGEIVIGGSSKSDSTADKTEKSQGNADFWVVNFFSCDQPLTFYADADADGFGNVNAKILACTIPAGYLIDSTDCDDSNALINPAATEICANSIDDNCDGAIDEDCCPVPTGETVLALTPTTAKVQWNSSNNANKYKIGFRASGQITWNYIFVYSTTKKLKNLTPETEYDWEVKAICTAAGIGTSDWSPVFNFTTPPLRIGSLENSTLFSILLYPNPGSGEVTLQIELENEEALSILLLDVLGREIYSCNEGMVGGNIIRQLDFSSLSSGTYFLRVVHNGVSEIRKLVIER